MKRGSQCLTTACIVLFVLLFQPVTSLQAEDFRVTKLLGDLNDTVKTSTEAQEQLVKMGSAATPGLIGEIKKYTAETEAAKLSAARCLRVLEKMGSPEARATAIEILALIDPAKQSDRISCLLLSEALRYLVLTCSDEGAINALYRFIKKSPEKWRASRLAHYSFTVGVYKGANYGEHDRHLYAWEGALDSGPRFMDKLVETSRVVWKGWRENTGDALVVDIFTPLSHLVAKRDPNVASILEGLLETLPYRLPMNLCYLSPDGFTASFLLYVPDSLPGETQANWLEAKARVRILLMRWLGELHATSAIDQLTPFLRSEHKDERDFSLLILQRLSSGGNQRQLSSRPSVQR